MFKYSTGRRFRQLKTLRVAKKISATNCRESFYLRHAGGFMAFSHLTSRTGRAEIVAGAHDVTSGRMFMAFLLAEIKQ